MKKILIFILMGAGILLGDVPASSQDVAALIRTIDERQKKIATLQAEFSQTRETTLAKKPLLSSGTVRFRRPDRVHWSYARPEQIEIAASRKEIWLYYPRRAHAERYLLSRGKRLARYMEPLLAIFEKPFGQLTSEYDLVYEGQTGPLYRFSAQPKGGKVREIISRVELGIDTGSGAIVRFALKETGGDRLIVEFKNMQINPPLAPEDLDLKMPPATRVQDQSLP